MEEEKEAVIQEEQTVASNDEQTQEQIQEQPNENQEQPQEPIVSQEEIDERGVPWKNRAMELERKLSEVPTLIQKTVQESLAATQQQQQPKQQEYTVSQLEQFAQERPEMRAWVEEEKFKLLQRNIEKSTEERLKAADRQRSDSQVRQQTEQWVVTHPKFKDCFVTDLTGNKVWNMNNPLTQTMNQILNQQDPVTGKLVKDRPDGLAIAAEMAYGRYMLNTEPKAQSTVQKLQKDLRKAQKQTMPIGAGVNASSKGTMTEYQQHKANYGKTYNPKDAQAMTKAYLKSIGLIKDQGE